MALSRTLPRIQAAAAASLLALAGAALAQNATTPAAPTTASAPAASGAGPNAGKLARADRGFIEQAAQNGNAEVESSKLALTKSTNADVKAFAQQMIDDHTKTGDELKTLAQGKGVTVPTDPSMKQKAQIKLLSSMNGANFDKRYVDQMGVNAHEQTVKLFQKGADKAKDADVKAFASKTLPALQHHLSMAQDLKNKVVASK